MPGAVIGLTSAAAAVLWGASVFRAVVLTAGPGATTAAVAVAAVGALGFGVVLQLLGSLLLDAVDAVFLC